MMMVVYGKLARDFHIERHYSKEEGMEQVDFLLNFCLPRLFKIPKNLTLPLRLCYSTRT